MRSSVGLRGRAGGQPEDFDSRKSERYLYEWALFPPGENKQTTNISNIDLDH